MSLLDQARIALLHREVYAAALKGLLTHGSARSFASERLGITPQYLSNLCNPDHDPPSPEMSARIVSALPIDRDRRLALMEHMQLAHESRLRMIQAVTVIWREALLLPLLTELQAANDAANRANAADQQTWARLIVEVGRTVLGRFNPVRNFLDYVQIALIVQNMQSILNRSEGALFTAKWVNALMARYPSNLDDVQGQRYANLYVNSLFAEVIAYRNLNLPRQADQRVPGIEAVLRSVPNPTIQFWLPHVLRAQAESVAEQPRFALYHVESLIERGRRLCEQNSSGMAQDMLLLDKALLNGYAAYGSDHSLTKGYKLARQLESMIASVMLSPIQEAVILAAITNLYHVRRDLDAWQHFLRRHVLVSNEAGLLHQLSRARAKYGTVVDQLIADSPPA